ncbi:MAG: DUF448 domain-containing protein [bacterium]|nr:DUF448 domain-containing protein [bacterium]
MDRWRRRSRRSRGRGCAGGCRRSGERVIAARGAGRRRTCIGCRRARPVGELVRFAVVGERLRAGRALPGRGAWVCAGDDGCLRRATAPERLRRAFRRDVPAGAADDLIAALEPVGHGVSPSARRR